MPVKGEISADLGVSLAPPVNTRQIRVHMQILCKWCVTYLAACACANMSELFTRHNMRSHAPRKDVIKAGPLQKKMLLGPCPRSKLLVVTLIVL